MRSFHRCFQGVATFLWWAAPAMFLAACGGSGATAPFESRAVESAATDPQFLSVKAKINTAGNLEISFGEEGLSPGDSSLVTASAVSSAVYGCIEPFGNKFEAVDTQAAGPSGVVSSPFTTLPAGKNGTVNATMFVSPVPPTSPGCPIGVPIGTFFGVANDSFSNVVLTDSTHSVTLDLKGTISKTLYPIAP